MLGKYACSTSMHAMYILKCREYKNLLTRGSHADICLWRAARDGREADARHWVSLGADIRACEDICVRAAAANGHAAVVRFLAENGADLRASGDLCVVAAAGNGHAAVVRFLVETGAPGLDLGRCAKAGTNRSCGTYTRSAVSTPDALPTARSLRLATATSSAWSFWSGSTPTFGPAWTSGESNLAPGRRPRAATPRF